MYFRNKKATLVCNKISSLIYVQNYFAYVHRYVHTYLLFLLACDCTLLA
jgi:hypothetical protein